MKDGHLNTCRACEAAYSARYKATPQAEHQQEAQAREQFREQTQEWRDGLAADSYAFGRRLRTG